jgi:hypothetical protein
MADKNKFMNYFYVTLLIFVFCFWLEMFFLRRDGSLTRLPAERVDVENTVVMDLGAVGSWYEPSTGDDNKKKIVMVLYDREKLATLRILDKKIFSDHHVLMISVCPTADVDADEIDKLCDAYECMIRYERWDRIVLMGMGRGAMMASVLYRACQIESLRLPSLLIHMNGVTSIHVPWYQQWIYKIMMGKSSPVWEDVSENYRQLQTPLLIFHSRNNKTYPFMDSIMLFRDLVKIRGCRQCFMIPLYGNEEAVLLSKENQRLIETALTRLSL